MKTPLIRVPALLAYLFVLASAATAAPALAKREAPAPVAPVEVGDVRLVVNHFENACHQTGGCVEVVDRRTSKLLRAITVYTTTKNPGLEGDVQDVFITRLQVEGKKVTVTDERQRAHVLSL